MLAINNSGTYNRQQNNKTKSVSFGINLKTIFKTKTFDIGDVLALTTGNYYLSPRGMEGAGDLIKYMTGKKGDLFEDPCLYLNFQYLTSRCGNFLLENFPQLKKIDTKNVNYNNRNQWLEKQVKELGAGKVSIEKKCIKPERNLYPWL